MMSFNPYIEAKAKQLTIEQIKSQHGHEGEDEEEEDGEKGEDGEEDLPKRPEDRYPNFLELFANYEGAATYLYIIEFPIRACLCLTVPDCRFEKVKDC